ncbi:MAG: hypothetical protein RIG61_04440 [Deltaproteobacteria bacterium]
MKISSPSGELDVLLGEYAIEGDNVVFDAEVGVWKIKIYLDSEDFKFIFWFFFRIKFILFFIKQFLPHRFRHNVK